VHWTNRESGKPGSQLVQNLISSDVPSGIAQWGKDNLIIMSDVLKMVKKVFTVGVVVTTIVWSLGVAALVPGVANATTCPTLAAGDNVKVVGRPDIFAVKYNANKSRLELMGFYESFSMRSWYADSLTGGFDYKSKYISISDACYATLPGPDSQPMFVNYRPGSYLVKRQSADALYVILPGNRVTEITSQAATALYGAATVTGAKTLSLQAFAALTAAGTKIEGAAPLAHEGMLVKKDSKTWYVDAGNVLREVTATGMTGNRFNAAYARTLPASATTGFTTGVALTAKDVVISDSTQTGGMTGPVVTGGNLNVALASDTPAGQSGLPISSTNIDVLKFNLVNTGSSDTTVDEVILKRGSTGQVTGLTAYLYDGETRVGTGKTFTSDTNEAVFSALNKVVPAGKTVPLVVRLKLGSTATTGNHSFSVNSVKLVSGTVTGLPVTGNVFGVNSGISAGTITIEANGTLSNPSIGDENATLAQFKLTAGTEDIDLYSLTLKQDGTLTNDYLSNFNLYQGTEKINTVATVNGRYVTFALNTPFRMVNGNNKIFSVKGNISSAAETAKTVVFFMYDDNDMKAVGLSYGQGVSVTRTLYNAADDNSLDTTLNLQGGAVTIANKSQSAHDVKVDTTENELGKVGITASADTVEFQLVTVSIATTKVASSTSNTGDWGTFRDVADDGDYDSATDTLLLRNIKLKDVDTGRTVGSAKAITDATAWATTNDVDTTLSFAFTDYFTVNKGTTRNIAVVADVNSAQISGVKYTATFNFSSGSVTVKDSKDQTVTDIVPATTIASYEVTTRSSALTISRASTPETKTVVKGSVTDALGIILAAGSGAGNDVKLTGLTLNAYVDDDTSDGAYVDTTDGTVDANELVSIVQLYDGTTKVAESSVDSSGNVVFNSNKFVGGYYTIPAGQTKTLIVKATVSGNAPYDDTDDAIAFTFAAGDVTVEANGTTFTPTVTGTNLNGTTSPSVATKITSGGTITVAADNGRPLAQVLLAGVASEQEVHRIKLSTTKETFTVDKLSVGLSSASTTYDNVNYLKLYDTSGNALSDAVTLNSSGTSTFTNLNISVPVGGTTVVVKAMLNAIGERSTATVATAGEGADTGDALTFAVSTVTDEFHAVGVSGTSDTAADAAASNTYQVVKSKPTFTVQTLPSSVLTNGTATIFKFSVAADANEDISLARVTPYVTFSDSDGGNELLMTANTLLVYDMAAPSTALNTASNSQSSTTGAFTFNLTSSSYPTVGKGQTKTFEIRADFTGVEQNDSISVKFVQDSAALTDTVRTGDGATVSDTNNNFIWSDNSADTDAFTSTQWMNSFLLPNWDTRSLTLSKS